MVAHAHARTLTGHRANALVAAGAGCKVVTVWRGFKLLIQVMAWKMFERISWCWNSAHSKITSFGYRRWAEVYVPTWDWKGFIGFAGSGGTGHPTARRWTQGKFQQCAAYCFQTKTPWVDLKVYADGHWAWASGGS